MEQDKSDLMKVMEVLSDELEGVEEYAKLVESVNDPAIKKTFASILADEKRHVHALKEHVDSAINALMK